MRQPVQFKTGPTRTGLSLATAAALALAATGVLADDPTDGTHGTAPGFGRVLLEDTRDVFKAPAQWETPEWRSVTWKALTVAGAMALLDEPARDYVQKHKTPTTDRIADIFEPFGAEYAAGVLLGYALVGTLADKPAAREVALNGTVSAIITSGLIVPALKEIAGRSRPHDEQGAFDFKPFSGKESFPSGHTAAAFTIAASIAQNNEHLWVKGLAYGVASLTGYARMEHDAHWLSDVTASAFIGVGVATSVSKLDRKRRGLAFTPLRNADGWGLRVSMTLD